ncbi:putative zinc finger, CCHC-type, retrotransposon gag domain protein [Tanacetum coccineum]
MANPLPPNHVADLHEDEPFEEEEEHQEKEEFKDEIGLDIDDEADDTEIIDPYEEVDPLNPPPPGNFYVGEGSSSAASAANHRRVFAPSPLGKDVNALHYKRPYDATAVPVAHVVADDPYIPAATDDPAAREETPPFEPQGSPPLEAIAADRAARNTAGRSGGNLGGSGGQEMVFVISECAEGKKVKFAAATLQGRALTWWNSQVATLGTEAANRTTWAEMKKLMTEEFCPAEEIQRMEHELWSLKVKDFNMSAYTQCFNELALLCPEMVPTERKKIEAYIRGLTKNIKGEVTSSKPASLNEVIRMDYTLMEQKA